MTASEFAAGRQLQIPPRRSCGAPVGMTRIGQLLSGRVATWTDGAKSGYCVKTADPLRSPEFPVRSSGKDGVCAFLLRKGA